MKYVLLTLVAVLALGATVWACGPCNTTVGDWGYSWTSSMDKFGFEKDQVCLFDGFKWNCRNVKPSFDKSGLYGNFSGYRTRWFDADALIADPLDEEWDVEGG